VGKGISELHVDRDVCKGSSDTSEGQLQERWRPQNLRSFSEESMSGQEIGSRKIVIVIPAFNESESIGRVIDEAREALEGLNFTILVVEPLSQYFRP